MVMDRNFKNLIRRLKLSKNLNFFSLLIILVVTTVSIVDLIFNLDAKEAITFNVIAIILSFLIGGFLFYMSRIVKIIAYFRAKRENLLLVQELQPYERIESD